MSQRGHEKLLYPDPCQFSQDLFRCVFCLNTFFTFDDIDKIELTFNMNLHVREGNISVEFNSGFRFLNPGLVKLWFSVKLNPGT